MTKQKLASAAKVALAIIAITGVFIGSSMLESDSLEQSMLDAQTASYFNY